MAVTLTISFTEHPRDKSKHGFRNPCTIGPYACAPPRRSASLYPMLPAFKSGKISTFAFPATELFGAFFFQFREQLPHQVAILHQQKVAALFMK